MDVVPSLEGQFDIVFIDADKRNYLNYLDMVRPVGPQRRCSAIGQRIVER